MLQACKTRGEVEGFKGFAAWGDSYQETFCIAGSTFWFAQALLQIDIVFKRSGECRISAAVAKLLAANMDFGPWLIINRRAEFCDLNIECGAGILSAWDNRSFLP